MNHSTSGRRDRIGVAPPGVTVRLIASIGRADFPGLLLSVFRELAGCDFCSAFRWDGRSGPQMILAEGRHPQLPGFALSASRAYEQIYWQRDEAVEYLRSERRDAGPGLLCMTPGDIRDAAYRRDCYETPRVAQRIALFDTCEPALLVGGYRSAGSGRASVAEIRRIEESGPTVMAALRRHEEWLREAAPLPYGDSNDSWLLCALEQGLSMREAQIAAGIAAGRKQTDVAKSLGLSPASVITYRRRAYEKLGVSDRWGLRSLLERIRVRRGERGKHHRSN